MKDDTFVYTLNPLLEEKDQSKHLDIVNRRRYHANSRLWAGIVRIMSFIMLIYVCSYWLILWQSFTSYPFIAIDPTQITQIYSPEPVGNSYMWPALAMDICNTLCVVILSFSGILAHGKKKMAHCHWKLTFFVYAAYVGAIIGRSIVLSFK